MLLDDLKKIDVDIVQSILNLKYDARLFFILAIVERQDILVRMYDEIHNRNMYIDFKAFFDTVYRINFSPNRESLIESFYEEIESKIPDTEDCGTIECSYLQNILIAILYFIRYFVDKNDSDFYYSIEKCIENVDLFNYEKKANYDFHSVMSKELNIYQSLVNLLNRSPINKFMIDEVRLWSSEFTMK